MERWILNPNEIDFTAGTSSPITTGAPIPYSVENAVYADGMLQFYASDGAVYGANGVQAGFYSNTGNGGLKELAIAPGPGSCNTWCMFWLETTASANLFLYYQEVVVGSNGNVSFGSSGQAGAGLAFGSTGGIAISQVVPGTQADRDVYFVSPHPEAIHQFRMTGLSVNFIQTFPVNTGGNNFICEADLSHDGKYLCWGNDNEVFFWPVGGGQTFPLITLPDNGKVYGVEFAPDNQSIYICHGTLGLLLWDPFSGIPPTPLAESNTYNRTQLEMALDGRVYAVRNDGVLGMIQGLNVMQSPLNLTVNSDEPDAVGVEYFALPDQIDGEDYSHFTGVPLVNVTATTVNVTAISTDCNTPSIVYNCNPILYGASFDGTVSSYKLDIQAVTPSCAVITGTGFVNYSSGWQLGAPPANLDLRGLTDGGGLNLANSTGKFAVTLSVMNSCGVEGTGSVGYLQVNGPPTPASVALQINSYTNPGVPQPPAPNPPGVSVGAFSGSFNISNSTGFITFYTIEIEQVDCNTGAFIRNIYPATTTQAPGNLSGLSAFNFNILNVPSIPALGWSEGTGFFGFNNGEYSLNNCFLVTVSVGNECNTSTVSSFLKFDCLCFDGPGGGGSALMAGGNTGTNAPEMGEDITVFPNPFSDEVSVNFYLPEDSPVTLQVFDASGKIVSMPFRATYLAKGSQQLTFDAGNLSTGIYMLKLATDLEVRSSQIIKIH